MSGRPLAGERVVVTRAEHQAGPLAAAFEDRGARVVRLPLIAVVPPGDRRPLERAARGLAGFDWLVLTSANAVAAFLPLLSEGRAVAPALPPTLRTAVVGPATAAALRRFRVEPAVEARKSRAAGLIEILGPRVSGCRVLVPQAEDAGPELARGLQGLGAETTVVVAYGKRLPQAAAAAVRELFSGSPLGWVTCTSPRIVRHLRELVGAQWEHRRGELKAVSIGPVTSGALRRLGVEPAAEAATPSDEELVRATVRAAGRRRECLTF